MKTLTKNLVEAGLDLLIPASRKPATRMVRSVLKAVVLSTVEGMTTSSTKINHNANAEDAENAPIKRPLPQLTVEEALQFAKEFGDDSESLFSELHKRFPPDLKSNSNALDGLCCAVASPRSNPLHVLLLGEPATGKTRTLDFIADNCQDTIRAGLRVTKARMTVNLRNYSPGLLRETNGKILLIDEFEKLDREVMNQLYEAMESGRVTVNGPDSLTYESQFSLIAAANPIEQLFEADSKAVARQIRLAIPPALLSRFHLVYLLRALQGEELRNMLRYVLLPAGSSGGEENAFLRGYFSTVRKVPCLPGLFLKVACF